MGERVENAESTERDVYNERGICFRQRRSKKNPLLVTLLNESSQHTRGAPELVCQFNRGHRSDPNDCLDALQINAGLRLGGRGGSLRPKRGSTQHDTSLQSAGDGLITAKGEKKEWGGGVGGP